ncbi:Flp pilus assembly protein, protease CpaA [Cognatishimia activa]|uniref:Flp pilus assembly protein, protease CpaA n=1 Tax=Cognatishimia activa TaxID=1715691 RepID=A0A0P1IVK3_9RHOB|nr:Flp pilus assembly protein, protease CpaA [Cognatishimia activa]CUK27599.1 Flp pilus assembly protein, protease CpaA [Cognatishimia activa]
MLNIIELLAEVGCLCLLIWIAVRDFRTLKVSNQSNLILLALYCVWLASRGFEAVETDLLVAVLFFGVALVMWLAKMMGAGDVKLYFVLALFIGVDGAAPYVLILLLISLLAFLVLRFWNGGAPTDGQSPWAARMTEFKKSGKLPYAVIMVASALGPICIRFFW